MKKRIIINYIYSMLYRMLDVLAPLVTTPYLSRVLGPHGIGAYSYTNSVASFFILFASAGINIYGQREIAYVQFDRERYTAIFKEICLLKFALTFATGAIYCAMTFWDPTYCTLYRILLINVVANAFEISWFFQGMEDFRITAIRNMIIRMLGVILIFLFVKTEDDLFLYALLCSLPILVGNLSLWIRLRSYLGSGQLQWKHLVAHLRPMFALFIPQIAIEVYTVLDKTMLGALIPLVDEVAYYEQAQKIIKMGTRFLTALGAIMMSRSASAYAEKGVDGVRENLKTSFRFAFFLGMPIMFGLAAAAPQLVPWFFGPGYDKVVPLMVRGAPIIMMIGISNIIGYQILVPMKHQKIYTFSVVGGALINLTLNLVLIPSFSSVGATVASVVAESSVTVIQIIMLRKILPVTPYFSMGIKPFISSAVMCTMVYGAGKLLTDGMFGTFVQILLGATVYLVMLVMMQDLFMMNSLRYLSATIKERRRIRKRL